jgi:hypothetical protein
MDAEMRPVGQIDPAGDRTQVRLQHDAIFADPADLDRQLVQEGRARAQVLRSKPVGSRA